jgi:ABC-2 type transport system permease protein
VDHTAAEAVTAGVPFGRLLSYDLRQVGRSRAVWLILAGVVVAGIAGVHNTAVLHDEQRDDALEIAAAEGAWYDDIHDRVRRYRQPSSTVLPYWQDPTDAAGFSRYFLRRHAIKPHLPLSALAVGHSDLQPYVVPVRLEGLFGGDPVYDYEPPRALALGTFDLAFALVWLLPLGVAPIVAFAGSYERDRGILPMVAAQPLAPSRWCAARGAAIAMLVVPTICAGVLVALAGSGVSIQESALELSAVMALVAAQCLLWIALGLALVARGADSMTTLASLVVGWILLTVGLPLGGSTLVATWHPVPPHAWYVDELREVTAAVEAQRDTIVSAALAAHRGTEPAPIDSSSYDYSTRLVTLTPEIERRLQHHFDARERHARALATLERAMTWISPQVAFQDALEQLAGTSTERHRRFTAEVRGFQLQLRGFMYPRILRQAAWPAPASCQGCAARLNFLDFDRIPVFSFSEVSRAQRAAAALRSASWLIGLALAAVWCARRFSRSWSLTKS